WSQSHRSSSARPVATRASRCSARLAAVLGSLGSPGSPACVWPTLAARAVSQLAAHSGGSPTSSFTDPSAQSSSRASACLHGNFLLGQEHRYAGPVRSTTVRYGVTALPRHSPHSAPGPAAPASGHARPDASDWATRCDGASGARASTRTRSQRSATVATLTRDTDIRRPPDLPQGWRGGFGPADALLSREHLAG